MENVTISASEFAALKARLAELESAQPGTQSANKIIYKVSAKGGLSAYGLQRWPVTLYRTQWERLIADAQAGVITNAIKANQDQLAVKPVAE